MQSVNWDLGIVASGTGLVFLVSEADLNQDNSRTDLVKITNFRSMLNVLFHLRKCPKSFQCMVVISPEKLA